MEYTRDDISKDIVVEYYDYVIKDDVDGRRLMKNQTLILDYQINDTTDTYPVELDNLKPNTQYTIKIQTRSEYGRGRKIEKTIVTNPVAPVSYLTLENTTIHAVLISWRKPEMDGRAIHSGDVPKYDISVCNKSDDVEIGCKPEQALYNVSVEAKPYKSVVYLFPEENVIINIQANATAKNQTTNKTEDWYSSYRIDLELRGIKEIDGKVSKEKNIFYRANISPEPDLGNRTHTILYF